MKVDTTCAMQAIHNANVSKETKDRFYEVFQRISVVGEVGRREFDYTTFMVEISTITDVPWFELSRIWEEFGKWFSQAIGVCAR